MSASPAERYAEFLVAELPKLAARPLGKRFLRKVKRSDVLDAALAHRLGEREPGLCLELGVHRGITIRRSAERLPDRRFAGFDSFEGFPDDGRVDWQQDFAVDSMPEVPANVELVKGWFSETLPPFLAANPEPIEFLHIDCDIYSSTCDVFRALEDAGRLVPGIVICFDELINYGGYLWNELLALHECLARTGYGVEWIGAHQRVYSMDESLSLHESRTYPSWDELRETGYREQAAMVLTAATSWTVAETVSNEVRALARRFERLSERRGR